MKHVEYSCDWCGAREPKGEDAWPEGWSSIDDAVMSAICDELMCRQCVLAVRNAIAKVRAERLAIRGVAAER